VERVTCPKCGSENVYKLGENFEGEFFECLDCNANFTRFWSGEIEVWEEA